jgi:hypothetical protein
LALLIAAALGGSALAADASTAGARVREQMLRMTDFLDTMLPGVLDEENITLHFRPKFGDLRDEEYMRFPLELRYGLTNRVELRGGTIHGRAPLTAEFRAGGDDGWIRGLREGELTGRKFSAASLTFGRDFSALLGKKAAEMKPTFEIFHDHGRIDDSRGRQRTANGYGVALAVRLPIGATRARISAGYAYSPESKLDRYGSSFVRVSMPFAQ